MIWVFERDGSNFRAITIFKGEHIETINGEHVLKLSTRDSIKKYEAVIFKNSLGEWQEFIVRGVDELRDGSEIYLEHSSYELHDNVIRDKRPTNRSVSYILGEILAGTRWTAGTSDISVLFTMNFYYVSSYYALKRLVEASGGELEYVYSIVNNQVVSRTINIKYSLGMDRGRIFAYSKDMFGARRRINDDIITALIGRGRGEEISENGYGRRITLNDVDMPDSPLGVDYVENVDAKNVFGIYSDGVYKHRFGTIEFDDIDDINVLYLETKKVLEVDSVPKVTYEVSVSILDNPEDQVGLGDFVTIIDSDFGGERLTIHGRVLKIVNNLLYPEHSEVTIGNIVSNMSYFQSRVENQLANFRSKGSIWDRANAFNSNNQLPASYIADLLAEWNTQANLSGGYTYSLDGQGTITYDRPIDQDPTQAVQIVGGTIRIANSKTVDDQWIWKTVINADGIAGEEILTNSITANKLSSDFGETLDLSSNQSINLKVEDIKGELDQYRNQVSTQFMQTSNDFTFLFSQLNQHIQTLDGETQAQFNEIVKYIRFVNGNIELGEINNPIKLILQNNRISFTQNGAEVAYISDNILYITDGRFLNSLRIGNFAFTPRSNGSLSFGRIT